MNELTFTMWLQGWVELNGGAMPTQQQWDMIKEHLALSFNKVTAPLGGLPSIPAIPALPFWDKPQRDVIPLPYHPPFDQGKYWLDSTPFKPGTIVC